VNHLVFYVLPELLTSSALSTQIMDCSISTSASTIRSLHHNLPEQPVSPYPAGTNVSLPSSPRSSALPSPPDSPSSDSVSSFPSVSSSFFFSSAAASSPHSQSHSDRARDSTQGLIIPSLTLPAALPRPTPYGQTLGDLRLLVLGSKGAGKSFMTGLLLEDNEDVVEVSAWEEGQYGRVLRASTNWVENRDDHGLEKFEPARNVEIIELPGYDQNDDVRYKYLGILNRLTDRVIFSGPCSGGNPEVHNSNPLLYSLKCSGSQMPTIPRCCNPRFMPIHPAVYCSYPGLILELVYIFIFPGKEH